MPEHDQKWPKHIACLAKYNKFLVLDGNIEITTKLLFWTTPLIAELKIENHGLWNLKMDIILSNLNSPPIPIT